MNIKLKMNLKKKVKNFVIFKGNFVKIPTSMYHYWAEILHKRPKMHVIHVIRLHYTHLVGKTAKKFFSLLRKLPHGKAL